MLLVSFENEGCLEKAAPYFLVKSLYNSKDMCTVLYCLFKSSDHLYYSDWAGNYSQFGGIKFI